MSFDNFEKYSRKKVSDHSSDLDTEALWDALEPQLEKPEKKRRFIFCFFGAGLALGFGVLIFNSLKINELQKEEVAIEVVESNNQESIELQNLESNLLVDIESEQLDFIEKTEHPSVKSENPSTKDEREELRANHTSKTDFSNNFKRKNTLVSKNNLSTFNQKSDEILTQIPEEDNLKIENLLLLNRSIEDEFEQPKPEKIRIEFVPISFLEIKTSVLEKNEEFPGDLPKIEVLKSSKNWQIFVGANFGYSKSMRKMTAQTLEPGATDFLQKRESTETPLELLSTGIDFELKNRKNWSFLIGISGNQLTERFDFENRYSQNKTVPDTIVGINYFENGDIQAIRGDAEQKTNVYEFRKVYNTFRWLETLAGAGYSRHFRRMELGINGGVLFGFGMKSDGMILDENSGYLNLKTDGNSAYKSTLGLALFSNIKIGYQLSPKWIIRSGFGFKNYRESFSHQGYPVDLKYQFSGVNLEIRHRLY